METTELKKIIDVFFEMQEQNEAAMLNNANTIEDLMDLVFKDSASNGFRKRILEKAKQIIDGTDDPRILWHKLGEMSVYPAIEDIRGFITTRVAVLVSKVSKKSLPEWFLCLLRNPKQIPENFLAIIYAKARHIKESLENDMSHLDEFSERTYERT